MKRGRRGKILLDTIDISIMEKLKRNPVGVMELRKMMDLKHINLKSHLTRLYDRDLIKKTPVPRSRKIMLSIPKRKNITAIFKTFK